MKEDKLNPVEVVVAVVVRDSQKVDIISDKTEDKNDKKLEKHNG
jgi:hypothetical protein